MYIFIPKTRDYIEWDISPTNIFKDDIEFSPLTKKLFPGDVLNKNGEVINSPYKKNKKIPGVLIISGKTYGNHKDKKLYKCVPADKKLPSFLVPYKEKSVGFSKKKINLYILFSIKEWVTKHPTGIMVDVIGEVNKLENYYQYEVHSKQLFETAKEFNQKCLKSSKQHKDKCKNKEEEVKLLLHDYHHNDKKCDRTNRKIFSIDPEGTKDIDDAIGITYNNSGEKTISIYIANVPLWLTVLNLWNELTSKVSTIYLPNKKIPMLPEVLSEEMCSLIKDEIRLAFVMDINIVADTIKCISFKNVIISVYKNYVYDEPSLIKDKDYIDILSTTKKLIEKTPGYMTQVNDSHELVEYYMKMMNHRCGVKLRDNGVGIYRSVKHTENNKGKKEPMPNGEPMPNAVKKILSYWGNITSNYVLHNDELVHDILSLDVYAQITSPIRRFVDIINMVFLQNCCGLNKVTNEINDIIAVKTNPESIQTLNTKMRNVKKVQTNCDLIYFTNKEDCEKIQDGYVLCKNGEEYTVYIPKLKLITYVKSCETYEIYKKYKYSIHTFSDEVSYHKKVRLQFCTN